MKVAPEQIVTGRFGPRRPSSTAELKNYRKEWLEWEQGETTEWQKHSEVSMFSTVPITQPHS